MLHGRTHCSHPSGPHPCSVLGLKVEESVSAAEYVYSTERFTCENQHVEMSSQSIGNLRKGAAKGDQDKSGIRTKASQCRSQPQNKSFISSLPLSK